MLLIWALGAIAAPFPRAEWHYDRRYPGMGAALFEMASKRFGAFFC